MAIRRFCQNFSELDGDLRTAKRMNKESKKFRKNKGIWSGGVHDMTANGYGGHNTSASSSYPGNRSHPPQPTYPTLDEGCIITTAGLWSLAKKYK